MIDDGEYQLAERTSQWALTQWPDSETIATRRRDASLRLRIKYQAYNPFKFILYSEQANAPVPPLP